MAATRVTGPRSGRAFDAETAPNARPEDDPTATADLHTQLDATCLADVGLRVPYVTGLGPDATAVLDHAADHAPVEPLQLTRTMMVRATTEDGATVGVVVMARPGQEAERGSEPLAAGEAAAPEWARSVGLAPGRRLSLAPPDFGDAPVEPVAVDLNSSYPDIAVYPEPSFWCGYRDMLRPSSSGDRPPPMVLVNDEIFDTPGWHAGTDAELRPHVPGLTRVEAGDLAAFLEATRTAYRDGVIAASEAMIEAQGGPPAPIYAPMLEGRPGLLDVIIGRAERVAVVVLPVAVVGAGAGYGLAIAGITMLGPSALLEPAPVRAAGALAAVAVIAGAVTVGAAAAAATTSTVDARPHRRGFGRWPWELIAVVGALVSYLRLRDHGGVELVGSAGIVESPPHPACARRARWTLGQLYADLHAQHERADRSGHP